jgi:hypothetical protein
MMKWKATTDGIVNLGTIEANSESEAYAEACKRARESAPADEGGVEITLIQEDKQLICDRLLEVLKITRGLDDLIYLKYLPDTETVNAHFLHGSVKTVNVWGDSGTAMIKDIIKGIV